VFNSRFCNEDSTDVHFVVSSKCAVFKESFTDKADAKRIVVFNIGERANITVASEIEDAVYIRFM